MTKIGIVHFTAKPAIGGVENMIDAQLSTLSDLGHETVLVVGKGEPSSSTRVLAMLRPDHAELRAAAENLRHMPHSDHPLVRALAQQLVEALEGCDQVWVHNMLTLHLNPFASVAVASLAKGTGRMNDHSPRWVFWCEDISAISRYSERFKDKAVCAFPNATFVAISQARRLELADFFGLAPEDIRVINPPVDALAFLGIGPEARAIACRLGIGSRSPVVFVPAKLLAHKNLSLVIHIARALTEHVDNPLVMLTAPSSPHEPRVSARIESELRSLSSQLKMERAVSFLPEIAGAELLTASIRDLMLLSDLVFLPSTEEGYGLPLAEAAALRVPTIAADIPAFRESGVEVATFVNLDDHPEQIAMRIIEIAAEPVNQRRRDVLSSMTESRLTLADLIRDVSALS